VSNYFTTPVAQDLATDLDDLLGGGGRVFFANSGAEANECAIKLARKWGGRGRHVVVSAYGSFHGRTLATLHATGQPSKHETFQPLPEGFRHVAWCDEEALDAAVDPTVVAAVLLEVVQGEGGVNVMPDDFLRHVRSVCDERGVLLVLDEVQCGLGRTGRWWAFEHAGVRPDVVTVAKSLGNGMPVAACWARDDVAAAFEPGDHGTTFGGQPLAAAAAKATLDVMRAERVPERAVAAGERLAKGLAGLRRVVSVRGVGLMVAAELDGGGAKQAFADCLDAGLIVNPVSDTALRFLPSLLVSDGEVDEALSILEDVL
jgi:acetylornithine/N-succinyldiaminopimelate aminotransferase